MVCADLEKFVKALQDDEQAKNTASSDKKDDDAMALD